LTTSATSRFSATNRSSMELLPRADMPGGGRGNALSGRGRHGQGDKTTEHRQQKKGDISAFSLLGSFTKGRSSKKQNVRFFGQSNRIA
jgi:hypothetical protein